MPPSEGPGSRMTGPGERRTHVTSRKLLAAGLATIVLVAACGGSTATPTPAPTAAPTTAPTTAPASEAPSASAAASEAPASPTPLAPDPAEAVIPNVESGATINFWTFYLSPTFDNYIK